MKSTFLSCVMLVVISMICLAPAAMPTAEKQSKRIVPDSDTVKTSGDTSDSDTLSLDGTPKIFFPETSFNFGVADQRQKLTHVFKVQNTGDALLKITGAHAS